MLRINKHLKEDLKAKSPSFYLSSKKTDIGLEIIKFLEDFSKNNNRTDVRVCLHESPNEKHHDMILLLDNKTIITPHKHKDKTETIHLMKGKVMVIYFSDKGTIKKKIILKKGELNRIPKNTFHTYQSLTKNSIFHETKAGPFIRNKDLFFAKWCEKYKGIVV